MDLGYNLDSRRIKLTVDHITPQSKDGTDRIENLQLLCAACNSTKDKGTQAELISRLKAQGVLK